MTYEDRIEYVKYRIETARKTFDAAKILAKNGFWNSAVNRLYYALFYAVNALLVLNETNMNFGMRYSQTRMNKIHSEFDPTIKNKFCTDEIQTKSHSATKSQFSLFFVKTGKFEKKHGRLLSELSDWRQKGDYDNIFDYTNESVDPLFEPVAEMIDLIEEEVNKALL